MADPTWRRDFGRLAELAFSFDLQVYPGQLAAAAALARAYLETSIILNLTGLPLGTDEASVAEWHAGIELLSASQNSTIKISGIGMTLHPWTFGSIRPFVRYAIKFFGVQRAMFASDLPVDKLYSDASTLYSAFDELTSDLSRDERLALFAQTAINPYQLPPAHRNHEEGNPLMKALALKNFGRMVVKELRSSVAGRAKC